jgi:hypothetical protein
MFLAIHGLIYGLVEGICYPLVNVNKKLWKDPPFSMGKSTISMAMLVYQRVKETHIS